MEYYLNLLVVNYKAQLLIGPYKENIYTVRARRSGKEEWIVSQHEELIIALYQAANALYAQDQKLQQPSQLTT